MEKAKKVYKKTFPMNKIGYERKDYPMSLGLDAPTRTENRQAASFAKYMLLCLFLSVPSFFLQ